VRRPGLDASPAHRRNHRIRKVTTARRPRAARGRPFRAWSCCWTRWPT
jgi:hypothetical protein